MLVIHHVIPECMSALNDKPSFVANFNYDHFYYL